MKKILTLAALCGFFIAQNAHATCSNYTSYSNGQVLTASSLNSLQSNYTNCINGILDGDNFTGTVNLHNADLNVYSDSGNTLKAKINKSNGDVILSPRVLGDAINCEINYSAGTITISGRDGVALSATNPCYVGIRSNSNGVVVTATFTSNITVTDGATSQTDGNLFGITDANWASAMPMFFGIIYNGTTPYFTLSRLPYNVSGAAAGNLCQLGDTDCDAQEDVMVLTTGLTLSSWVDLPITQVAWLQGSYATSGGAWTFSESTYTGFNDLYTSQRWTMPLAQNGAASGTYFLANGGTAPVFSSNSYVYQIDKHGICRTEMYVDSDGGTDGAGAVSALYAIPYKFPSGTMDVTEILTGFVTGATTITSTQILEVQLTEGTASVGVRYLDASAVIQSVTNAMFSNGGRIVRSAFTYNAMNN